MAKSPKRKNTRDSSPDTDSADQADAEFDHPTKVTSNTPDDSELSPSQDDLDDDENLDALEDTIFKHALLMRLKGHSHKEIAMYFNKSERAIGRWLRKAKEQSLVRIDKLKPWNELAATLLMHRPAPGGTFRSER